MADRHDKPPAVGETRAGGDPEAGATSAVPEETGVAARTGPRPPSAARRVPRAAPAHPGRLRELPEADPARTSPQGRRDAPAALAHEVLPALDNLQRALDAAAKQGDRGPLARGWPWSSRN